MFFDDNKTRLEEYAHMSQTAGARADYVQGGGGNTSVKLKDGLMAIKASGFCLGDVEPKKAYAVLNYEELRKFYNGNEPSDFSDVEKEGSEFTKKNTIAIEGMDNLRPSVEAGFHSILDNFVLHTHSVYGNLAACSTACKEIAAKAFEGADYSWGWVPYTNPGSNLTFAIRNELKRVEKETGKKPAIILMQNHGIIAHHDDEKKCLEIHADANERIAKVFGITGDSFPAVSIKDIDDGMTETNTPYLENAIGSVLKYKELIEEPLYPDQMVFLIGTLFEGEGTPKEGEAYFDVKSKSVKFAIPKKTAQVVAETLTAIAFITENIDKNGYTLSTMGAEAKDFIANWESEKYRKSLASK